MLFKKVCVNLSSYFKIGLVPKKYSIIASVLDKPKIGELTEVKGWVKSLRIQKEFIFADVNDGSCAQKLQIIIPKNLDIDDTLTYGSSVHITGKLSKSPRGQLELLAENVTVLGKCVVLDGYPFNPRTIHPPEYIRQYLHLRSRTNYMAAVLRVRHAVTKHIHDYFSKNNFLNIHTPILTSNDCEGAGEVFKVQPENEETMKAMMQEGRNRDSVYFGAKTFLTVSGQLHLEAICRGMGDVYTLGPTFRAENSRSRLHLSEFYMLEAEIAFCDSIEKLQSFIEHFLKYLFVVTRNTNDADLYLIDKNNKAPSWLNKQFLTLTYDEARNILAAKGLDVSDEGINKEQELTLVDYCQAPVFIVQWPKNLKSFYMKESPLDGTKVDALDLLAPLTGEIVGGSLREDDYTKLEKKLPSDALKWYLELRKFGNIPTGGFGLGLERILQVLCNVPNIKDTLPFPRWPHNCDM
ncbi:probable asparagine--tRNA ligase, mitochondrial isoform X1 [Vanessa atalanta]|uniref:probable asparagine--tRNA ligase, mitochondrial isoform X1 n=1 Tax=Vanessa atalanta TaxID=42275 RepID=UPI001FCD0496|nr:probable asparagine--tRNA ligase, mitochondrial isoform X1 [Vanessa atalanta]